jgi:hypothetical protein
MALTARRPGDSGSGQVVSQVSEWPSNARVHQGRLAAAHWRILARRLCSTAADDLLPTTREAYAYRSWRRWSSMVSL